MVTENWDSRSQMITKDGDCVQQKLTMTWAEWNNRTGVPCVGDSWSSDRPDLVCTQVSVDALSDTNDYAAVEITYSTQNAENRMEIENQITSWQEEMNFGLTEAPLVAWTDTVSGSFKFWTTEWAAYWNDPTKGNDSTKANADTARENLPSFKMPVASLCVVTFGDTWYISRILSGLGTVNSNNFLQYMSSKKAVAESWYNDDIGSFNDIGHWMLAGCDVERIRNNCWRYVWRFDYDPIGWNTTAIGAINLYSTTDFSTFFNGMDLNEPTPDVITRS